MKYPRTVEAALANRRSLFEIAEGLATEIPKEYATVGDALQEAATEIVKAGGEPYSVNTLKEYRLTGIWFSNQKDSKLSFSWVEGFSFTAHDDARRAGTSARDFRANPKTSRETRQDNGKASKDGPLVDRLTKETAQATAAALAAQDEEKKEATAEELAQDPTFRAAAMAESARLKAEQEKAREGSAPKAKEGIAKAIDFLRLRKHLSKVEVTVQEVLDGISHDVLEDDDVTSLQNVARRLRVTADYIDAVTGVGDLDKALEELLSQ